MADAFDAYGSALDSPASNAAAVTPDDGTDLTATCRGLYIGAAGNVAVYMKGSTTSVSFVGAEAGTILPIRCDRVLSTGTTATNIVALW